MAVTGSSEPGAVTAQPRPTTGGDYPPPSSTFEPVAGAIGVTLPYIVNPGDVFTLASIDLTAGVYIITFSAAGLMAADPDFLSYSYNLSPAFTDPDHSFHDALWPVDQMQTWSGEEELRGTGHSTCVQVVSTATFRVDLDATDLLGGTVTECSLTALRMNG